MAGKALVIELAKGQKEWSNENNAYHPGLIVEPYFNRSIYNIHVGLKEEGRDQYEDLSYQKLPEQSERGSE